MVIDFGLRLREHLVAGVWSTNANEKLILWSDMSDNVALAFTAVLPSNQHIH
jgi:hypothetical protein